jgi:hypothetical protein
MPTQELPQPFIKDFRFLLYSVKYRGFKFFLLQRSYINIMGLNVLHRTVPRTIHKVVLAAISIHRSPKWAVRTDGPPLSIVIIHTTYIAMHDHYLSFPIMT